jgi:hypothetical protein
LPLASAFQLLETFFQLGDATLEGLDETITFDAPRAWLTIHTEINMKTRGVQLRGKLPTPRFFQRWSGNEIHFWQTTNGVPRRSAEQAGIIYHELSHRFAGTKDKRKDGAAGYIVDREARPMRWDVNNPTPKQLVKTADAYRVFMEETYLIDLFPHKWRK